ncbi:MAG: hypothetical protein JKX79_09870, partial [Labilibaculum sp.]|nr:hypothetical protein [Labilibaculum sp.]
MKRLLLFVVLFLLLFASVGMGTFRLLASGKFKNDIFSNFPSLPSSPPPVPMNDLPCNSIPLLITTTCSFTQYNNVDATDSRLTDNTIPAPSCGSYSGSDVWFSALVPSSGEIVIATYSEGTTNWLNKVNFAVYSGSCTSLTEIDCYSANPDLYVTTSDFSGRTPGETLYIRVYDQG